MIYLRDVKEWLGTPRRVILRFGIEICGGNFVVGRRYLIDGVRTLPGGIGTNVCTLTRPIELAADVIEHLERAPSQ